MTLLGAAPKVRTTDPAGLRALPPGRSSSGAEYSRGVCEQSDALYRQVLAIDPRYAPAWTGLGAKLQPGRRARAWMSSREGQCSRPRGGEKALEIDPDYAPAHAGLGWIAMSENDLVGAARHHERALALDPTSSRVLGGSAPPLEPRPAGIRRWRSMRRSSVAIRSTCRALSNLGSRPVRDWTATMTAIGSYRTVLRLSPGRGVGRTRNSGWRCSGRAMRPPRWPRSSRKRPRLEGARPADGLPCARTQPDADAALDALIAKYEKEAAYNIAYVYSVLRPVPTRRSSGSIRRSPTRMRASRDVSETLFDKIHSDPRWLPFLRKLGKAPEQLAKIKFKVTLPPQ